MTDRRTLLRNGTAVALGSAVLTTFASLGDPAAAFAHTTQPKLPDPATTPVPNAPIPAGSTFLERRHLETFDELDFEVFTHADWTRLGRSHADDIRVHWPDGHYTDGIDAHLTDLKALFVWAPDTRILEHPLRLAQNGLTAVTGVMRGTFTRPMPDGKGGLIQPTGRAYAINMCTVGVWNRAGRMSEEFLFWDNLSFYQQIGLA
jgi:SnoaL-like polyketide cyclase